MKNINWFAVMIICIWLVAMTACRWTKNSDPIGAAAFTTIVAGIGYFLLKG